MMRRSISLLVLTALSAGFYACSSVPTTNTSTIRGTLAGDSYPSAPTAVVAVDETQHATTAQLSPTGAFELSLVKGHQTGAANFDMGAVHYVTNASTAGFRMTNSTVPAPDGECENGVDSVTGAACVDGDENATCEYGEEADDEDDGNDGECENGVDANTGAVCVDDDAVEAADGTVDAASPMAVPERSIPNEIGGCNDGEDGDDETNDD